MPIRIPFARRTGVVQDENQRPGSTAGSITTAGFERVDTVGSKASSIISIRSSRRSYDTGEYKLSGRFANTNSNILFSLYTPFPPAFYFHTILEPFTN